MKKNILKIAVIIICFAFVLSMSLMHLTDSPEELQGASEEHSANVEEISEQKDEQDFEQEADYIELVNNPKLRILLTTADFSDNVHDRVKVTSDEDFKLFGEDETLFAEYNAWEIIDLDDFGLDAGESLVFKSQGKLSVLSLERAQGTPQYYGELQIYREEDGYTIINIVPMEEYLLTVVPSEMLSTYPLEALKAQAICARSYAYHYVLNDSGLPHDANMNDSTDYQVYNNIQETETTNLAVKETEGMLLTDGEVPVPTYFFSTSCGFTTNETIWKEYFGGREWEEDEKPAITYKAGESDDNREPRFASVAVAFPTAIEAMSINSGVGILYSPDALMQEQNFRAYINSDASDFLEAEEPWYRWTYTGTIDSAVIYERLQARYMARPDLILTLDSKNQIYVNQPIGEIGKILDIKVLKRLSGGVADELCIVTDQDTYLVIGEYNIRYVLSDGISEIIRNDESVVTVSNLLPSAYFILEPEIASSGEITSVTITGGGYGHGVGMSQNGARCAALQGMTCKEILSLFYKGLEIKEVK